MAATTLRNKPRMGRVPIVPWVRCADPKCDKVLAQRMEPWRGEPLWIQCRYCRAINRISEDGVWIVDQAGAIQPYSR